jgi:DDE_Tnp_1-associated
VSACPSSPITVLAACSDSAAVPTDAAADPAGEDLLLALSVVSDPRKSRGVRHQLITVLAAAACAVLAGARSYVAISEWAHDLPVSIRLRLGMGRRAPSESTMRRVLQRVNPDEAVVHRDRLRSHQSRVCRRPRRQTGGDHPRALAHREPAAMGPRRDFRRRPVPDPHRHRPSCDGHAAQLRYQPPPPGRRRQHRRSLPRHRPPPTASHRTAHITATSTMPGP